MKQLLFICLMSVLLCLCSCAAGKAKPPVPPIPNDNPPGFDFITPALGTEASAFSVAVGSASLRTNTIPFAWNPPPTTNGLVGYNLWYGTNSGKYSAKLSVGNVTNYVLTNYSETISTNPVIRTKKFPDGRTYTNVSAFYYAVTALYAPKTVTGWPTNSDGFVESGPSNEILWPPPPPPPWTAVLLSWGAVSRNVTVIGSSNIAVPIKNWPAVTNLTGTNVLLPLTPNNKFFKGVTTNNPPISLKIVGSYLNVTN